MPIRIGQTLKGSGASYCITKVLKDATVFQAMSVPPNDVLPLTRLVVIKHEPRGRNRIQYERERGCYELESIARSPYIRGLRDLIGHDEAKIKDGTDLVPQCMVLEWMDSDLWQLPSEPFRSGSELPRIVAKAVLEALVVFVDLKEFTQMSTQTTSLCQASVAASPRSSWGILEIIELLQGLHIRAPEVWRGIGIFHSTDIWSLGVTLAHWLASKVIFGPSDKIIQDMTEAWCLAKIIRLAGPLEGAIKPEYEEEFATAEFLEKETFINPETAREEKFIKLGTLRQELEAVPGKKIEAGCIDFIESLLVVDHTKRPTAREALRHPWLHDDTPK